jgi:hypothetical protein
MNARRNKEAIRFMRGMTKAGSRGREAKARNDFPARPSLEKRPIWPGQP